MKKSTVLFIGIPMLIWIFGFIYNSSISPDLRSYTVLEKTVEWVSMTPLIRPGSRVRFSVDYYKSNVPKTGDILAYNYGGKKHMLIKILKATSEDRVEIVGSNLKINGELMENSAGEEYVFSPGELKLLGIYVRNGKIPEGSYLIFGDNVTDSIDSRKFGAVSRNDLLGKFILP